VHLLAISFAFAVPVFDEHMKIKKFKHRFRCWVVSFYGSCILSSDYPDFLPSSTTALFNNVMRLDLDGNGVGTLVAYLQ